MSGVTVTVPVTPEMLEWARKNGAEDEASAVQLFKERYLAMLKRNIEDDDEKEMINGMPAREFYAKQAAQLEKEIGR